ncbi:acyl-CoA dehydrogenase [Tsukamurella soli]|uniref:Acyl-CoA dehydrogenase family protein n=1 Tax=Tsukamurella soli TaxID=644556 RepID=A0ABP8J680_9ACTN
MIAEAEEVICIPWAGTAGGPSVADAADVLTPLLRSCGRDVAQTVRRLPALGRCVGVHEATTPVRREWSAMATIGAFDLTVARIVEPHVDALAILDEAGSPLRGRGADSTWGVYAAEGPGVRLEARESRTGWTLTGTKPWCSLAQDLDYALITAWTARGIRRLFAVDLHSPGVAIGHERWVARGLSAVDSPSLICRAVAATPIGPDGWYHDRPGFAIGGMRVAAVWFGAAMAVGRTLRAHADRGALDQIGMMHLGAAEIALHQAGQVMADAAHRLDGDVPDTDRSVLGLHVRSAVRRAAEEVIERTAHALGPTPLVRDAAHAARIADLTVYLCQEHAERDVAALGNAVAEGRGLVL